MHFVALQPKAFALSGCGTSVCEVAVKVEILSTWQRHDEVLLMQTALHMLLLLDVVYMLQTVLVQANDSSLRLYVYLLP